MNSIGNLSTPAERGSAMRYPRRCGTPILTRSAPSSASTCRRTPVRSSRRSAYGTNMYFPRRLSLQRGPRLSRTTAYSLGYHRRRSTAQARAWDRFGKWRAGSHRPSASGRACPSFCRAMSVGLAELVRAIAPTFVARDVEELPLLTLGSQIQGGINNLIGQRAITDVFSGDPRDRRRLHRERDRRWAGLEKTRPDARCGS